MASKSISNEDLKQCLPQLQEGWWETLPEKDKAWYRRFWALCQPKPPRKPQPRYYGP